MRRESRHSSTNIIISDEPSKIHTTHLQRLVYNKKRLLNIVAICICTVVVVNIGYKRYTVPRSQLRVQNKNVVGDDKHSFDFDSSDIVVFTDDEKAERDENRPVVDEVVNDRASTVEKPNAIPKKTENEEKIENKEESEESEEGEADEEDADDSDGEEDLSKRKKKPIFTSSKPVKRRRVQNQGKQDNEELLEKKRQGHTKLHQMRSAFKSSKNAESNNEDEDVSDGEFDQEDEGSEDEKVENSESGDEEEDEEENNDEKDEVADIKNESVDEDESAESDGEDEAEFGEISGGSAEEEGSEDN